MRKSVQHLGHEGPLLLHVFQGLGSQLTMQAANRGPGKRAVDSIQGHEGVQGVQEQGGKPLQVLFVAGGATVDEPISRGRTLDGLPGASW